MNIVDLPYALSGLLTVGVFLLWFYSAWQSFVIERARQRVFRLRDEWFDLVASNPVWRDHPTSRLVRSLLNAQIRWMHKFSLPLILFLLPMPQVRRSQGYRQVQQAVGLLPTEELRKKAKKLQDEAMIVIALCMVQRSLVAWIVIALLAPVILAAVIFKVARRAIHDDAPATAHNSHDPRLLRTLKPFAEIEMEITTEDRVVSSCLRAA